MMSIKVDPNTQSNNNSGTFPERKPNLLERYVNAVYEGYRIERAPCPQYCEEKWNERRIESDSTQNSFMNKCLKDCDFFKSLAECHRRN